MTASKKIVNVTITSDLMCPWCWVGLKKLQAASKSSNIDTNITWKPYFLRPNLPEDGVAKGGTPASRVGDRLRMVGEPVGIQFTGLTDRTPNTTLFHATIRMLQDDNEIDSSTVTKYHEAVFEGYFTLGVYPDQDGLLKAAKKLQTVDNDSRVFLKINSLFNDPNHLDQLKHEVHEEAKEESYSGVSGVPSFQFNGNRAFSGAQDVETFETYLAHYAK